MRPLRALAAIYGVAGLAACGSSNDGEIVAPLSSAGGDSPVTTVCNPVTYEGDARTDPCAPLTNVDAPAAVPAACDRASYHAAVAGIEGGLRVYDAACDGDHLVARYGIDACAPESGLPEDACVNAHTAYFVRDGDVWDIVSVDNPTVCGSTIPDALCAEIESATTR